jgi:hypothetical protein
MNAEQPTELGIITIGFIVDGVAYDIDVPETPTLTANAQQLRKAADIPHLHSLYVNEKNLLRQIGFYESVVLDKDGTSEFSALPTATMISG